LLLTHPGLSVTVAATIVLLDQRDKALWPTVEANDGQRDANYTQQPAARQSDAGTARRQG
jgi:hypothetical protein